MKYDIDYEVKYTDNFEYRIALRQVFRMDNTAVNICDEMDAESRDELIYDDTSISAGLDYICDTTKSIPVFSKLFLVGAGRMLSIDLDIGLAVMFSYDYFELFHLCLCDYFKNPSEFTDNNTNYTKLWKKIS